MSIPGVINMHKVFHNPAQYNYASLFHNTLALAFSKAYNTCLFGLFSLPSFFPLLPVMIKRQQNVFFFSCALVLDVDLQSFEGTDLTTQNLKGSKLLS